MIFVGSKAPEWAGTIYSNGEKKTVSSEELSGSWYVIYWWPFDFTGVCNSEILGFQELESEFSDLGVRLLGASCDSFFSHSKWFADADSFPNGAPGHDMIADNTHAISEAFGVYLENIGAAARATVLVDPNGVVQSVGANFLPVARDPNDVLTTAKAFIQGGACTLPGRSSL